jgi:HK97 family phage portal protein
MNALNRGLVSLFAPSQKRSLNSLGGLFPFFSGGASNSQGQKVTGAGALKISAFWCAVNTIANSVALLPKNVYQKKGDIRGRLDSHPVHYLIHDEPNTDMSAFLFWFSMTVCMLMRGNAYALIVRDGGGRVVSLELLMPGDVNVNRHDNQLFYKVKGQIYFASEILHIPNFSFNGIMGVSVLQYAADNLGVALAADEFATNAYSDKGVTYGVAESDLEIKDVGRKNIEVMFNNALVASNKKHRVAVFDEGLKYKSIMLNPAESEFIKAKASGVEDIARWFNIPLHKLHTSGEGGYNFLVEMSQEYLGSTIAPIGEKIKQECQRKLFSVSERGSGHYIMLNYRKLLETNPEKRANYYQKMIYSKVYSPNEVRELEDMNPYDGGDEFLQMTNLMNESQVDKTLKDEKVA